MGKGEINRAGAAFGASRKRNKRSLFRRYPGLVTGIGPELLQPLDILRLDLPFLGGHFTDGVEVGQGVIDDMGGGQAVQALLEPAFLRNMDAADAEYLPVQAASKPVYRQDLDGAVEGS